MEYRRRIRLIIILAGCFFIITLAKAQQQHAEELCPGPSPHHHYDFEAWNFYEILALEEPGSSSMRKKRKQRKSIETKDIKRAFRGQSQLHHPDKRNKHGNSTTTVEESNSRFSRIAEAYEVLKDPEKKRDYDEFLKLCEEHMSSSSQDHQSWSADSTFVDKFSSFFHQFSTDPRQVFEDFFYGDADGDNDDDLRQQEEEQSSFWHDQMRSDPIRTHESREVMYDPYTGQELVRLLQTEEFAKDQRGCFRYRIIAQEFVAEIDHFRNTQILQPISDLYLLDEGYRCAPTSNDPRKHQNRASDQHDERGFRRQRRKGQDSLFPGDHLTHDTDKLLVSANGRYVAGLSGDCELLVMSDNSAWQEMEEKVVWNSDTYVPGGKCFVSFHQERPSHLIVVLGTPRRPRQILWYSEGYMDPGDAHFFARLDNDGAISVYQLRLVPIEQIEKSRPQWLTKLNQLFAGIPPRTRASKAWVSTRNWVAYVVLKRDYVSVPNFVTICKCVSSTSPAGCNRPARRMLQLGRDTMYVGRRVFHAIDGVVDKMFALVDDNEEGLDNLLYIVRSKAQGVVAIVRNAARKCKRLYDEIRVKQRKRGADAATATNYQY